MTDSGTATTSPPMMCTVTRLMINLNAPRTRTPAAADSYVDAKFASELHGSWLLYLNLGMERKFIRHCPDHRNHDPGRKQRPALPPLRQQQQKQQRQQQHELHPAAPGQFPLSSSTAPTEASSRFLPYVASSPSHTGGVGIGMILPCSREGCKAPRTHCNN